MLFNIHDPTILIITFMTAMINYDDPSLTILNPYHALVNHQVWIINY